MSEQSDWLEKMRAVFMDADVLQTHMLSWNVFQRHMTDENVKALLELMDLDVSEVFGLFLLLDRDGNGFVDVDEFLSGCMRLKGPAKQVDLALLLMESTRITRKIAGLQRIIEHEFELSR